MRAIDYAWRSSGRSLVQANPDSPIYPQLSAMVRNTFGLAQPLREAFAWQGHQLEAGFVFDGFDDRPALDLLLVSSTMQAACVGIDFAIEFAEQRLRRGLLVLVVGPRELQEPRWFIKRALAQPRTWVFGDEGRLAAMTSGP